MFRRLAKLSEKIIPNAKTSVILEECKQAVKLHEFDKAHSIYNQIPLKERECKLVRGMFAKLKNEEHLVQHKKDLASRLK